MYMEGGMNMYSRVNEDLLSNYTLHFLPSAKGDPSASEKAR